LSPTFWSRTRRRTGYGRRLLMRPALVITNSGNLHQRASGAGWLFFPSSWCFCEVDRRSLCDAGHYGVGSKTHAVSPGKLRLTRRAAPCRPPTTVKLACHVMQSAARRTIEGRDGMIQPRARVAPDKSASVIISSSSGHAADRVDLPAIVQPKSALPVRLSADRTRTKQK
jgi:hypothetical protein